MSDLSPFMRYAADAYIHERVAKRIAREGRICNADGHPWVPGEGSVSYGVTASEAMQLIPFGQQCDWSPVTDRLDAKQMFYFTWSPFSSAWRRYFCFETVADGEEFARLIREMGGRHWSPEVSAWV